MERKIEWLNIAKGYGILLVVLGHLTDSFPLVKDIIYSFHMPFFFIISGLCYKDYTSFKYLLKRKTYTLAIPWVICGSIVHLLYSFQYGIKYEFMIFQKVLFNIGALWFVQVLFLGIIGYYLLSKITNKNNYIIALIVGVIAFFIGKYNIRDSFALTSTFWSIFFISVGNTMKKNNIAYYISKKKILLLVTTLYTITFFTNSNFGQADLMFNHIGNNVSVFLLRALTGSISLLSISILSERSNYKFRNIIVLIGENTFVILSFHLLIIHYCRNVINMNTLCLILSLTCILVILAWLFNKYLPIAIGKKRSNKTFLK